MGAESARPEMKLSDVMNVLGSVTAAAQPLSNVLVIAFNLSNFGTRQTFSDNDGRFRLPPLPAGVYRVIAIKRGFAPAVATITPNRKDLQLKFKLENGKTISREQREQLWEIRRGLPSDVLRELDLMLAEAGSGESPRFSGQMASLAALPTAESPKTFAATEVGVQGALQSGWSVDIAGRMQVLDRRAVRKLEDPLAESTGVVMRVHSGEDDSYRIASYRNSWRDDGVSHSPADMQTHDFEWKRPGSTVQLRYTAQENLFRTEQLNSERFELLGQKKIVGSGRSDLDVSIRVGQDHWHSAASSAINAARTADIRTNGRFEAARALDLHYGLQTRIAADGYEWAPQTGAELRLAQNVSLVVSGLYKIFDERGVSRILPAVVLLEESTGSLTPRYRYSVGLLLGNFRSGHLSAIGSSAEIDSIVRIVFDGRFDQFWDGLYLEEGDIHHDVTLAYKKEMNKKLIIEITSSAGRAAQDVAPTRRKSYVSGTIQSLYRPSGTSFDLSYRVLDQPQSEILGIAEAERLNVRMGQALYLPLDMRLLFGIDLTRAPQLTAGATDLAIQKRFVGGVSLGF